MRLELNYIIFQNLPDEMASTLYLQVQYPLTQSEVNLHAVESQLLMVYPQRNEVKLAKVLARYSFLFSSSGFHCFLLLFSVFTHDTRHLKLFHFLLKGEKKLNRQLKIHLLNLHALVDAERNSSAYLT